MEANNNTPVQSLLFDKMSSGGILTPEEFETFFKEFSSKAYMMLTVDENETKSPYSRTKKLYMNGNSEGLDENERFINMTSTFIHWINIEYKKLYQSKLESTNEGSV